MNMQQVIMIDDHGFTFEQMGIRNKEEPFNLLPYKMMHSTRTKATNNRMVRFMYDTDKRCIADLTGYHSTLPASLKYVEFVGICDQIKDNVTAEIVAGLLEPAHQSLFWEEGCFKAREVPMVKILGNPFIVDSQNYEMVNVFNRAKKIGFDKIQIMERTGELFFDFNTDKQTIAGPSDDLDFVSIAILPPLEQIDPIGYKIINSQKPVIREHTMDLAFKPGGKGLKR